MVEQSQEWSRIGRQSLLKGFERVDNWLTSQFPLWLLFPPRNHGIKKREREGEGWWCSRFIVWFQRMRGRMRADFPSLPVPHTASSLAVRSRKQCILCNLGPLLTISIVSFSREREKKWPLLATFASAAISTIAEHPFLAPQGLITISFFLLLIVLYWCSSIPYFFSPDLNYHYNFNYAVYSFHHVSLNVFFLIYGIIILQKVFNLKILTKVFAKYFSHRALPIQGSRNRVISRKKIS